MEQPPTGWPLPVPCQSPHSVRTFQKFLSYMDISTLFDRVLSPEFSRKDNEFRRSWVVIPRVAVLSRPNGLLFWKHTVTAVQPKGRGPHMSMISGFWKREAPESVPAAGFAVSSELST